MSENKIDIKALVKDNHVCFNEYRKGIFYYQIVDTEEDLSIYSFPVPLEDVGDGTLKLYDKAITFMRWIRKAIEDNTLVVIGQLKGEYGNKTDEEILKNK